MAIRYSLGSSVEEQERLFSQVDLYGDLDDIVFGANDTVCEVGCGPGANLRIAQHVSKYIGIDISETQIERAKKRAKELDLHNAEFHLTDGDQIPLADACVDVAFSRCVLIHQPDPRVIAKEMYRITKPHGRLIMIEPHTSTYYCAPQHENLVKCYQARTDYVYGHGKGCPDIALNLYPLLKSFKLTNIDVRSRIIAAFGKEKLEWSKALLHNWWIPIKIVADDLLKENLVSKKELELAEKESQFISEDTFIYQAIWIAEATK